MSSIDYRKITNDTTTKNKSKGSIKKNSTISNSIEKHIFNDLVLPIDDYKPENTFSTINEFIGKENSFNRILFSDIYSFVSSLDNNQNTIFMSNLVALYNYSRDIEDDKFSDVKKFIVKLYDHIHLSILQDSKIDQFFDERIKNAKTDLGKEVQTLQSQSITILGIFASFVVTFVGGLSFSKSLFDSVSTWSIYRLIVVILLVGFILLSICFSLYWFIYHVINKNDTFDMKYMYFRTVAILGVIFVCCVIAWSTGFVEERNLNVKQNIAKRERIINISTISSIE